jgi:translation initiation factor 2B subunit (eIF-2B alpha/beta/delta family)
MWTALTTVRALDDRDPTTWSDNTVQVFHGTMKTVDVVLQKAHLTTIEHGILQAKLIEETKRKSKSRRSIQKGGASATADELRAKIKDRDKKERTESLRKAKKKLTQAVNKAKRKLKEDGVQARKDEQARLQRLADYAANDKLPPLNR